MASGIIIHITVGSEKRTEFFTEERIRIGSDDTTDLQIHTGSLNGAGNGVWLELENSDGVYRIIEFDPALGLQVNGHRMRRFVAISDGDRIDIPNTDITFTFFSLTNRSALITTNRETPIAQFIEEAALEARTSPKRDDAKAFLREFTRELLREVSWTTKAIVFVLAAAFIYGLVYVGYSVSRELQKSRETTEAQSVVIKQLETQLGQTSNQIGTLEKTNSDLLKTVSLAPNLRASYGSGVCLIVGVYDLVDKKTGKVLRYPDQQSRSNPYEPAPSEDSQPANVPGATTLTTEGTGSPVEYDFIGTGFHVGEGYIVTNRHVVQPWTEDDAVKQMLNENNGRARVKRLVAYFPNYPQPFAMRVRGVGTKEDLAVASVDAETLPTDIPVLPLDGDSDADTIGKTVVTMGYPSGPDRLLAMVDDDEAIRKVGQRLLERFGYRVIVAVNGQEAVELYERERADIAIVITDMSMPVMDGPATVRALRTMNPEVRIIVSSGLASDGSVARATGCAVRHFMSKPYTAQAMLQTLHEGLTAPSYN